jgi:DNA-binding protein H-NS
MNNLIDIQSQIQKLQKQASEIKAREFDSTVRDILSKMNAFGITVKDLQVASAGKRKGHGRPARLVHEDPKKVGKGAKAKAIGTPVAAKFRGPNGETWSGRGLTPRWLATLIAQGQPKESFAIVG